jgi:hypothetical protein
MFLMRQPFSLLRWLLVVLTILFAGCTSNNNSGNGSLDVSGLWLAPVSFVSCSPTDVCTTAGFVAGSTANARMNLSQSGNNVSGTYTYDGAGISADVSGNAGGNQVVLDGTASNPFGRVTVHLVGIVSNNNRMQTNISHQILLIDGRGGTVLGTAEFIKQ